MLFHVIGNYWLYSCKIVYTKNCVRLNRKVIKIQNQFHQNGIIYEDRVVPREHNNDQALNETIRIIDTLSRHSIGGCPKNDSFTWHNRTLDFISQ